MSIVDPEEVLTFWFSPGVQKRWFNSTAEFDDELREKFGATLNAALAGELDHWLDTATGAVALVIVLDQFPLNIHRGEAASFAGGDPSLAAARRAIDAGFDQQVSEQQQTFLYMPFMHSEDLDDQDRCVQLLQAAGSEGNLKYAQHHRDIVRRFGRFPHRNRILGRPSTPDEEIYLSSDEAFHG